MKLRYVAPLAIAASAAAIGLAPIAAADASVHQSPGNVQVTATPGAAAQQAAQNQQPFGGDAGALLSPPLTTTTRLGQGSSYSHPKRYGFGAQGKPDANDRERWRRNDSRHHRDALRSVVGQRRATSPSSVARWVSRSRLEPFHSEGCGLVDHPIRAIQSVRDGGRSRRGAIADRVAVSAQVDGLGRIQRADDDRRRADITHEVIRGFSEQGDGCDVVCHLRWHRRGYEGAGTPSGTTAEVTKPATTAPCEKPPSTILVLGQLAAVAWMWLTASLIPCDDRFGEFDAGGKIGAGRVVDRIHVDRLVADLRPQCVDERLSDPADTGRLAGTPGEHHLDVGARLSRRGWDGGAQQQRPACHHREHQRNERFDEPVMRELLQTDGGVTTAAS